VRILIFLYLKRLAWFIFKAPQRRMVGWATLLTDIKGLFSVSVQAFRKKEKEVIWVCTGNKNRSKALLENLVSSLAKCKNAERLALSVADCESTDIADLETEIRKIWKGKLVFSSWDYEFHRSSCFNRALKQAKGNVVFVCDADISVPVNIVDKIDRYVTADTAWFPVCQWQKNAGNRKWKWFSAGTGIFASTWEQLLETGLYDETFLEWGKEDWDLFFRFYKAGIMPLRTRTKGLYHHWHPSSKPEDYTNMF
jgi:glycosyltransferase involved in cell wall biosynthesis